MILPSINKYSRKRCIDPDEKKEGTKTHVLDKEKEKIVVVNAVRINLSSRKRCIDSDKKKEDTKRHAWNEEKETIVVANTVKNINCTLAVIFPVVMLVFNVTYFFLTV